MPDQLDPCITERCHNGGYDALDGFCETHFIAELKAARAQLAFEIRRVEALDLTLNAFQFRKAKGETLK